MKQYIDKDALVAEIEKELNTTKIYSTEYVNGKKYALKKILSFIDTLEVKEVDLKEEFYDFLDTLTGKDNGRLSEDELFRIAEYFFELGLSVSNKAMKGE